MAVQRHGAYDENGWHIEEIPTSRDDDHQQVERPPSYDHEPGRPPVGDGFEHGDLNQVIKSGSVLLNPGAHPLKKIEHAIKGGQAAGRMLGKARQQVAVNEKTPQKRPSDKQPGPPQKRRPDEHSQGGQEGPSQGRQDSNESGSGEVMSVEQSGDPGTENVTGGTLVGGGLRQGSTSSTRSAKVGYSYTVPKKHTWAIKMDQENYQPKIITTNVPDSLNHATVALKSRWYEVPDNEITFYLDKADIEYIRSCGRYFKIKQAGWRIIKSDVVTINTRTDAGSQSMLQTQWQPSLGVSQPTDCLPFGRARYWSDENGVLDTSPNNTFDKAYGKCGNAHNGVPTYLPKIEWYLQNRTQRNADTGDMSGDLLLSSNLASAGVYEHIDILWNCMTEYEMSHPGAIGARKQCMPGTRTFYRGPYGTFAKPTQANEPYTDDDVDILQGMVKNYQKHGKQRNWYPRTTSINSPAAKGFPFHSGSVQKSLHMEMIGPDPWDLSTQYRNNLDAYMPHMEITNPPTFICLNRLPKIPNQSFEIVLLIEFESYITIEVDVPMLFPFNNAMQGSLSTTWHGDNRKYMVQNDKISSVRTEVDYSTVRTVHCGLNHLEKVGATP